MSNRHPVTVKELSTENGELTKSLGETVEVELPKAQVVHNVKLRVQKGSLDAGSYSNANECFDALDNVKLQIANNDLFDVDGEALKVLNQRMEQSTTQDTLSPTGAGREATYNLQLEDPVPVSKVSTAKLEIDLPSVSDISGGSQIASSPSEDFIISVIAEVSESGRFKNYAQFTSVPDDVAQGDGRVVEYTPSGAVGYLILHEDTASVTNVKCTAVYNGRSNEEIVNASVTDLRSRLRRQLSGTVTIPDGYVFIPVAQVNDSMLSNFKFELDVDSAGDVEIFTTEGDDINQAVEV